MERMLPGTIILPRRPELDRDFLLWWANDMGLSMQETYRTLSERIEELTIIGPTDDVPPATGSRRFFYNTTTSKMYFDIGTWEEIGLAGKSMEATVWDDLRVSNHAMKSQGVKAPTFGQFMDDGSGSTGVFTWNFVTALDRELFFSAQLPHRYKPGTDLKPHVHWSPQADVLSEQTVRFGLEYTVVPFGSTFPNSVIITADVAAKWEADKHEIKALPTITGTTFTESTMLVCRFFREGSHANDTYTSGIWLHEFDFHFEIEKDGTETEYPS